MANSYGTPTNASTIANADGAANGTYSLIGQYDLTTAPPHEVLIAIKLTATGTPATPFLSTFFVTSSFDNSTFTDAPTSANETVAKYLGSLTHPDTTGRTTAAMPVSPLFGGALPRAIRVYVKNGTGNAYGGSGTNAINAVTETFG